MIDMNGDGLVDIVDASIVGGAHQWNVYLNNGAGFPATASYSFTSSFAIRASASYSLGAGFRYDLVDFNGDGLPDLVNNGGSTVNWGIDTRCENPNDGAHYASCLEVYLNTGQGFNANFSLVEIPPTPFVRDAGGGSTPSTSYGLFDVNGDGLPDWVDNLYKTPDGQVGVLLNLGGTLETPIWVHSPYPPPFAQYWEAHPARPWTGLLGAQVQAVTYGGYTTTYTDAFDFNGDGVLDFVSINTTTGAWTVQLAKKMVTSPTQHKNAVRPNLMTVIDNGLGGKTMAFYSPSTRYDNTGGDGQPDLPFVSWVTSGTRRLDGSCTPPISGDLDAWSPAINLYIPADNTCIDTAHELAESFTYQDGRFDAASREFRGFRTVYRTDIEASITRSTFGQDTATKGRLLQRDEFAGAIGYTGWVRSTQNVWSSASGFGLSNRTQVWLGANFVYNYDLNGLNWLSATQTFNDRPDAFGNILHTCRVGTPSSTRLDSYAEYAAPSGSTRVHDKPSHSYSQYAGPDISLETFDEKKFYYDGGTEGGALGTVDKGNPKVVESVLNSSTSFKVHTAYDNYGNIKDVTDQNQNVTHTDYDTQSLYPSQVTNALGQYITTVMDYRFGKPLSVTGPNQVAPPNQQITQYAYDAAGRTTCVAKPGDSTSNCSLQYTYTFGTGGQPSSVAVRSKEPNQTVQSANQIAGSVTTTEYIDPLGRHLHAAGFRVVNGVDQTIISDKVDYDWVGRVATRYDAYAMSPTVDAKTPDTPSNGSTTFDYYLNGTLYPDPLGRVHKVNQHDGTTRITNYAGFTTTLFDEQNHQSVAIVDHLGRTIEKDVYTGTAAPYTLYASTVYTYHGSGRVYTSMRNGNTNTKTFTYYDALGRKTQVIDPDSGTWQYSYDAAGNLTVQQDPKTGQHVQFCYEALNRVTKKLYVTNDDPTPLACSSTTSEMIQYAYDTGPTGTYPVGQLTSVTETHPNGAVTTGMTYDARGRVWSETKTVLGKAETTNFQYDASNTARVWKTTYPDGEVVTASFDHGGQPYSLAGSASYITSVTYDLFGRPLQIAHGDQTTDARAYYGTQGSGSFQKGHRLMQVKTYPTSTPNSPYLDLTYSDYTARGFLWHLVDNHNGGVGDVLSNTTTYSYDDLARLSGATYNYVKTANNPTTLSYTYDALGNVLSKQSFSPISSSSASVVTQAYTYGTPTKPHQPTQVGGAVFQYDPNGNASVGSAGQVYTFDADDHLKNVNAMAGSVNFLYDYQGRRVAKLVGTSTTRYYNDLLEGTDGQLTKYYFLGGMRVAAQRINSSTFALAPDAAVQVASVAGAHPAVVLLLRRDLQVGAALSVIVVGSGLLLAPWRRKRVVGMAVRHGHVIAVVVAFGVSTLPWPWALRPLGPAIAAAQTPPLLLHFHTDHLGSTQVITQGSSGTFFRYTRYNAYGELRGHFTAGGALTNDCGTDRYCHEFTGYDTEPISGLDYAGARYYDSGAGMFLSHDPAAQFASPYAYGPWNPVNGTDPTGTFFFEIALLAAFTFIQVGSKTGNTIAALEAAGLAAVTAGVANVISPALGTLADAVLTPTEQYAVAVAAGAYGTYESARQGLPGLAVLSALGTLQAAYGFTETAQGANGEGPATGRGFDQEESGTGGGERVGPHRIMSVDVNQSGPAQLGDPLNGAGKVSQGYVGSSGHHGALDIGAPQGTPIYGSGDGIVTYAGPGTGYGRYVDIQDVNFNVVTRYGHESGFAPGIGVGATVQRGQLIGYVGNVGLSSGPHLHFEVITYDAGVRWVDPRPFLPGR